MNRQINNSDNIKNEMAETSENVGIVKRKSKVRRVLAIIAIVIIAILLVTAVSLFVMINQGKKNALAENKNAAQDISVPSDVDVSVDIDSDSNEVYVYHDGKKYKYNDKVTTILFAGIDKRNYEHIDGVFGTAGQADAVFVMALNTETGQYKLMAVSRDTMVDVNVYDSDGNFQGIEKQQLCLAYGYGDGKKGSCENLKKSVSRIFFGIPINSYAAVDFDVISILNDQVGGVTVEVIEDLTHRDPGLIKGNTVTLSGTQAEIFVQARDIYGDENQNNLRMERQKVFLTSFIKQTLNLTKEDFSVPLNMYNSIQDYLVTDIDASMIAYYTSIFLKTGFSADDNLMKVPGKAVGGERYAEYYTDTDEFFDTILDIYYIEVD